jgi:hypothetical protein
MAWYINLQNSIAWRVFNKKGGDGNPPAGHPFSYIIIGN